MKKTAGHRFAITPLLCFICSLLATCQFSLLAPTIGLAMEVSAVNIRLQGSDIYATTSVRPDAKFMNDISNGISKELTFYIDLFRVWSILPDEFVTGRRVVRILRINPIKREYVVEHIDGYVHLEKRFKDLESMVEWAMNIIDMKLTNIKELEHGEYFVKVTVDSRIRRLPPVVGYLLFFLPEKEFNISKDSQIFKINPKNLP